MVIEEDNEIPNGWPLGLGNLSMRLTVPEVSPAAVVAPSSLHMPSSSFSSFASSNLDTESTASFFQDRSVSLGRLIGIQPGNNRVKIVNTNTIRFERCESVSTSKSCSRSHATEPTQGLCVPLFHNAIEKLSRSKSCSRH